MSVLVYNEVFFFYFALFGVIKMFNQLTSNFVFKSKGSRLDLVVVVCLKKKFPSIFQRLEKPNNNYEKSEY